MNKENYKSQIKKYGPWKLYDETKTFMEHAYTQNEILNCTVSGKTENSAVQIVKPTFTSMRQNKINVAL